MHDAALWKRLFAEFLGSMLLAATVIGSGIAAATLSPGDIGLELFENAVATAAGLFAIILIFGPISGAHLNPVVSFVDAGLGRMRWREAFAYTPFQAAGCIAGALLANVMFSRAIIELSHKHRISGPHWVSEVVATIGLVLVIFSLVRSDRAQLAPVAVGSYIAAAYFFTSSTSFANPAITVGRMFSNSFAGISPSSVLGFISAQLVGGGIGFALVKIFYPHPHRGRHDDEVARTTPIPIETSTQKIHEQRDRPSAVNKEPLNASLSDRRE